MKTKSLSQRSLAVVLTTILLLVAVPVATVFAATTAEIVPTGNGTYTDWTGVYTDIDEGTGAASCNSNDSAVSSTTTQRESVSIPLTSIPNGSLITDVNVIVRDRGDISPGGTYKTFVRLNGTNSPDSATTHNAVGSNGGC